MIDNHAFPWLTGMGGLNNFSAMRQNDVCKKTLGLVKLMTKKLANSFKDQKFKLNSNGSTLRKLPKCEDRFNATKKCFFTKQPSFTVSVEVISL